MNKRNCFFIVCFFSHLWRMYKTTRNWREENRGYLFAVRKVTEHGSIDYSVIPDIQALIRMNKRYHNYTMYEQGLERAISSRYAGNMGITDESTYGKRLITQFINGENGRTCRCGFHEASHYQPSLEWTMFTEPCKVFKPRGF